jgi:hypothetical protein
MVTFAECRLWDSAAGNDGFVIAKHEVLPFNGYSKVPQEEPIGFRQLDSCSRRDKLGTVCGCFNGGLELRIPVDWCLVQEVQDACNGLSVEEIVA